MPELRLIAQERGLCHKGKKPQLIARLAIWVRDEVSSGCKDLPESRLANEEHAAELDVSTDEASSPINVESEDENALSSEDLEPTEPQLSKEQSTNSDITAEGKETLEFAELPSDGVESDDGTECSDDDDSVSSEELELVGDKGKRPLALRPQAWRMLETEFDEFETDEVFDHGPSGNEDSEPRCRLRSTLQTMFGHDDFRDGQEWAIRRCLNQQRSLLVAPTGFGKSLCYALPAAMMDGVCVVVSPLLSLIHDQIRVLPPRLPAATLSGKISTSEMAATLDDIIRGRIKIVFVSPERLTSQSFRRMFRSRWNPETEKHERQFPDVSLLCVDEAHCLSQWAHNFRPSYLRLSSMMQMIQPKSVLAITATAGPRVVNDISRSLHIEREGRPKEDATGVRVMKTDRDNIDVKCLLMKSQGERLDKVSTGILPLVLERHNYFDQ